MRVLKYLRGHIPAVALIVLLLVAQSFCELSLPAYTSRIVDTGIQSGGIEYAAPLALTDKTMDGVRLFLSDDDAAAVSAAYTDADGVWTINDTAQLPDWETVPLSYLCAYYLNGDGAYAEGAMDVLAHRYQQAPNTVKAYLRRLAGQQVPDGRGDASEVLLADISRWPPVMRGTS